MQYKKDWFSKFQIRPLYETIYKMLQIDHDNAKTWSFSEN